MACDICGCNIKIYNDAAPLKAVKAVKSFCWTTPTTTFSLVEFRNEQAETFGRLFLDENEKLAFEGDVDKSAETYFDCFTELFNTKLGDKQSHIAELEAQVKNLELELKRHNKE